MSDLFDIRGRHVLITGASSGIGAHFAHMLAKRGATVTLAARRRDRLERGVAAIGALGGRAVAVEMDVTDGASIAAGFDAAEAFAGSVQILVNNAGIARGAAALTLEDDDWQAVMKTNLDGAWHAAREAASRLVRSGKGGSIVNVASILGLGVTGSVLPYAVSKAGLVQMTKALALEWARHGIRVNALAPGYLETEINREFFASEAGKALVKRIPQRRMGKPEDLDGALLLLISDAGSYITGSIVTVDGGHLVRSL